MPLQYAIQQLIPRRALINSEIRSHHNSDVVYHPVPQHVAEADDEQGFFCLTNNEGEQITKWTRIRHTWVSKTMELVKHTDALHKDVLGEQLNVGDYIAHSCTTKQELSLGRVIAFTSQKVRILTYHDYPLDFNGSLDVVLKYPAAVIKIQPNRFSE